MTESSFALDDQGHYTYMTGAGPDGARTQRLIAKNARVGDVLRQAIKNTETNFQLADQSQVCMMVVGKNGPMMVRHAVIRPIKAAPSLASEVITGKFHGDESCDSLTAISGTDESGHQINACAIGQDTALLANGATKAALTDQAIYYIVGTVEAVTQSGVVGQVVHVTQIADMNE